MKIERVRAFPISFSLPPAHQVRLGIGTAIKRDAVLVCIETSDGIVGWGEAHAARAPTAIAELVNSTLASLIIGMPSDDIDGVWERIYQKQLVSHGAGTATVIGLSGIDLALWDVRGKRLELPVCKCLNATPTTLRCYAGGISLAYQPTAALLAEAQGFVARGYKALKLRVGERVSEDIERIRAVREAFSPDLNILVDANTQYTFEDVQTIAPVLAELGVEWLEEPFPAHDYKRYLSAKSVCTVALAAGENHYTRFDFERLADEGAVTVWQPDLSKCGGLTEALRIANLATKHGIAIHPHTSVTNLNMAASLHYLCAIPNRGYFEADCSPYNPFRSDLCDPAIVVDDEGRARPPTGPGLGMNINPTVMASYPVISGGGYV